MKMVYNGLKNPVPYKLADEMVHYVEEKWPVFPINPKVKGKYLYKIAPGQTPGEDFLTANGSGDATLDPAIIKEWCTQWPKATFGFKTGKEANLVVVSSSNNGLLYHCEPAGSCASWECCLGGEIDGRSLMFFSYPKESVLRKNIELFSRLEGITVLADNDYSIVPSYYWAKILPSKYNLDPMPLLVPDQMCVDVLSIIDSLKCVLSGKKLGGAK